MKKILFLFVLALLAQLNNLSAQSLVIVKSGDGHIQLNLVNCDAYYNKLLYQAGNNAALADMWYKKAECRTVQQGFVTVTTNACAADAIDKATTQDQKEAILFDYVKLSVKEFCVKYAAQAQKETQMQMKK